MSKGLDLDTGITGLTSLAKWGPSLVSTFPRWTCREGPLVSAPDKPTHCYLGLHWTIQDGHHFLPQIQTHFDTLLHKRPFLVAKCCLPPQPTPCHPSAKEVADSHGHLGTGLHICSGAGIMRNQELGQQEAVSRCACAGGTVTNARVLVVHHH